MDEFDEVETTEEAFDRMMAAAEPVMIDQIPHYYAQRIAADGYYTLTRVPPDPQERS
jgi:hypothetical protein